MNAAGQLQCMYVGKDFLFKILHLTLNVLNKAISFEGFGFGLNIYFLDPPILNFYNPTGDTIYQ